MPRQRIYLDHNASAPLLPAARDAMVDVLKLEGNPSSIHAEGRVVRGRIEAARRAVADLVGAPVEGVIFTSNSTEAAAYALTPNLVERGKREQPDVLFVIATDHVCLRAGGRFAADRTVTISIDGNGLVHPDALRAALDANPGTPYLAVGLVNSETGAVQEVATLAAIVRERGGMVLCDVVQAVGRMPVDIRELGVDFAILSAHKIGGPRGVGALVLADPAVEPAPLITGGSQEQRRRAGTENVTGIVGFGAAALHAMQTAIDYGSVTRLSGSLEAGIRTICAEQGLSDHLTIFAEDVQRSGNVTNFAVEGMGAQTALIAFDLDGIALSSGSACSSGKVAASAVLLAMGVAEDTASCGLRVSLGLTTTQADVAAFLAAFRRQLARHPQAVPVAANMTTTFERGMGRAAGA
ncbi:cysteine desulfurase [Rhizobiaceae bacterium]|nr:cysteine desulfurase [Rhizobiaceae bacterium]